MRAVLLDAFGTLLDLLPPAPRLRALLADAGHHHPEARVAEAMAAEIRHYRRNHDRGRDRRSLQALRIECAGVIAAALGPDTPPPAELAAMLVESLVFVPHADAPAALDALDAAGVRLGVVSNWDCGLPEVLDRAGLGGRFEVVCASAAVGVAKPAPGIFRHALTRLRLPASAALHCGDRPEYDCAGAAAAGVRAVIVDRRGGAGAGGCARVGALTELAALAR